MDSMDRQAMSRHSTSTLNMLRLIHTSSLLISKLRRQCLQGPHLALDHLLTMPQRSHSLKAMHRLCLQPTRQLVLRCLC